MLIKVKVFPGSAEEEVVKKSEDAFDVWVQEEPVRGMANRAVVRVLASYLKISESKTSCSPLPTSKKIRDSDLYRR